VAGTSVESTAGAHPADEHGSAVEQVSHGRVVSYNPDAPSEEWGWHGSWRDFAPKGSRVLLWIGCAVMFLMLIGNHRSHVENYYLVIIGLLMAAWLLRTEVTIRRERKRRP
jgi:hypothetical protein